MTTDIHSLHESDNRPNVYFDGALEAWIYRGSSSGQCVRALVASALDYDSVRSGKMNQLLDRTANEGNIHEAAMRTQLRVDGHVLEDEDGSQAEVLIPIVKGLVYIRGHIDGLIAEGPMLRPGIPALWEAKTVSDAQWKKWMAKGKGGEPKRFESNYRKAAQITCYMEAFPERDVLYQTKRRSDGMMDNHIIPRGQPPIPFKTIRKKILLAESFRRREELPGCDLDTQWGCDFWYLHEEEEIPEGEVSEELKLAVAVKSVEYLEHRAIQKEGEVAEKAKKEVGKELIDLVGNQPFIDTGEFKVSVISFDKTYVKWGDFEAEVNEMVSRGEPIDGTGINELIAKHTSSYTVTYPKVTEK